MRYNKKNKNKKSETINYKLFKNNELLNYLKNKKIARNNSISDSISLNDINKNLLSNRYIYQPKFNNILKANSTTNNFRKKIILKNSFLASQINRTIYHSFYYHKNKSQIRKSEINNFNNIQINLNNNNPNKIIFNQTVKAIGSGESLLFDIMNNQKKFDEFQKENYYNEDLPPIKKIANKIWKSSSFIKIPKTKINKC
jgi:hypothetical protein